MDNSGSAPRQGIGRLLEIAGRKKAYLLTAALFAVLHAACALVPYILMFYIIQQLLQPLVDTAQVNAYLWIAVIAGLGSYALLYCSGLLAHIAAFNILYELRRQMANKLGRVSLGFVQQFPSGVLKKIVSDDIERIEGFIAHQIPDFVKGMILPVLTISYLFYVDWRLAAISFVPLLILMIWIPLLFRSERTKGMMEHHHQSQEDMNSNIVEFVHAMPVMKIFSQTADNFKKYSEAVNQFATFSVRWLRQSALPFALVTSFMSNASLPILALGTYLYLTQGLAVSTLILFLILGVGYLKPVFTLANMGMQIILINKGVERMDMILRQPDHRSRADTLLQNFQVSFDHVIFAYEPGVMVLKGLSFTLPQASITAFIGPSGAGKSTAAQLIARFWDVNEGAIRIGGTDVRDIANEKLLEHVSFVFQESFLFHDSIYENIRMGMDRTKAQVIQAAKAARCHDFIVELPVGYQTPFGGDGVYLSGGEKQRIQLARAILKDAPILILDEATAFSDPENEAQIQAAMSQLISGKTVIIIAHRLSTIVDADQIILFDQGSVAAKGTHQELLNQSPMYQQMWRAHTRAQEFAI